MHTHRADLVEVTRLRDRAALRRIARQARAPYSCDLQPSAEV